MPRKKLKLPFEFVKVKTKSTEWPFNLKLLMRGKELFSIPCIGEYACGKVVESIKAAEVRK